MDQPDENFSLQSENQQLKERVARLEKLLASQKRARNRVVDIFTGLVLGKSLKRSVSKFVDEAYAFQVEKETIKEVIYAALHRLTRVGFISLLLATAPLVMIVLQTFYLKKQNEKLDFQNRRIEQQTFLQEADRRSSLVFLFDNVLDKMDDELKANPTERRLSPQLVGRIVALSKALKPYRYLDTDTLTERMTSPERGQLLISLISSKLHPVTYEQILQQADFSFTAVKNVQFDGMPLKNINLSYSMLENVSLVGSDLTNANFTGAELIQIKGYLKSGRVLSAKFDFAIFNKSSILRSDFSACSFKHANFIEAEIRNTFFREANLYNTDFQRITGDSLDFSEAKFINVRFAPRQKISRPAAILMHLGGALLDSSSLENLKTLPLAAGIELDAAAPKFLVNRDTLYVDERGVPFVEMDSVRLFQVLKRK